MIHSQAFFHQVPMQERLVHFVWFASHILRSLTSDWTQSHLTETLQLEVRAFQAELHHTQRILAGYSEVLARAQDQRPSTIWGQLLFFSFTSLLGLTVIWWLIKTQRGPVQTSLVSIGDTVEASDSESDTALAPVQPARAAVPTRPSSLGRGRATRGL